MEAILYSGANDHYLRVSNLRNKRTGAYINSGAVVQITQVTRPDGTAITHATQTFPIALAPRSGTTTGEWEADLVAGLNLTGVTRCRVRIQVNPASTPRGERWLDCTVVER